MKTVHGNSTEALRQWADGVAEGSVHSSASEVIEVVQELLDTIDDLHARYAHEGGKPQIMTTDILTKWIAALYVPSMTDIYQTSTPNIFYATFSTSLMPDDKAQIRALGVEVIYPNSPLRNRYMLVWQAPRNDEQ